MNGLYYYKLVSPYTEDVTKNCKLTINEIDSNFFNLKSNDIEKAEFVREHKVLVLTRRNGEKLFVDLSSATYDFGITTEQGEDGTTLTFKYDSADGEKVVTIENVMTADSVKKFIQKEGRVVTDGTLKGVGSSSSPLGIKNTEETGMYAPVIGLIDTTRGGKLPKYAKLGTRFLTKEYINDYGFLYNGSAVAKIKMNLQADGRGWRIPTKSDWDKLLNSIEPCDYKNHDSARCHVELGKYAGKFLKSECGWLGQDECRCGISLPHTGCTAPSSVDSYIDSYECHFNESGDTNDEEFDVNCDCGCDHDHDHHHDHHHDRPIPKCETPTGVDRYGFGIMPSGIATLDAYKRPIPSGFKEKAILWTSTHVFDNSEQDVYVKEFEWDKGGVSQSAECGRAYYSIRLVKDYDGSNFFGAEYIDGVLYNTILHAPSGQIWLAENYASRSGLVNYVEGGKCPEVVEVNGGQVIERRKEIFLNEWNGNYWDKKLLKDGDTVVIEHPRFYESKETSTEVKWTDSEGNEHVVEVEIPKVAQHNIEFRVFTNTINCDKILINTDDLVVERVVNIVVPMLEAERAERIAEDCKLSKKIDDETFARIREDDQIRDLIEAEERERTINDSHLWDAIIKEASARTQVEQELWDAIAQETSARTEVDGQLWEGINGETSRAQEAESQLWEGINGETARAQQVEAQLWEGINGETARAQEVEAQLWDAIAQETSARTEVDDQIWEALNNEVERAKAREDEIDGQLISADVEYVMKVAEGFNLVQKNGGLIHIGFDGNYGQI